MITAPKSISSAHTTTLGLISFAVCQAIGEIYQHHPDYLAEKYRSWSWEDSRIQAQFIQRFTATLSQEANLELLKAKLGQYLQKLFSPECFQSLYFQQLDRQVSELLRLTLFPSVDAVSEKPSPQPAQPLSTNAPSGIAVLLLDVENLKLDTAAEAFLSTICTCPVQIKVAFANWRTIGKRDAEFHQRGYQMIHVPVGANSADMKMTAIGSSIFLQYPNIQEILVCSSDADLSHLCHMLTTQGLTVYSVSKRGEGLNIKHTATGSITHYSPPPAVEIPSVLETVQCLKTLVKEEQQQTQQQWIKLSKISLLYRQKVGVRIGSVISHYDPTKTVRQFLEDYSSDFVIHQLPEKSEVYVAVFEVDPTAQAIEQLPAKDGLITTSSSTIRTRRELEASLIEMTTQLIEKSSSSSISLSSLAARFNQQHEPITKAMKRLNISGTFPNFVNSLRSLKIHKDKQGYQVTLVRA